MNTILAHLYEYIEDDFICIENIKHIIPKLSYSDVALLEQKLDEICKEADHDTAKISIEKLMRILGTRRHKLESTVIRHCCKAGQESFSKTKEDEDIKECTFKPEINRRWKKRTPLKPPIIPKKSTKINCPDSKDSINAFLKDPLGSCPGNKNDIDWIANLRGNQFETYLNTQPSIDNNIEPFYDSKNKQLMYVNNKRNYRQKLNYIC